MISTGIAADYVIKIATTISRGMQPGTWYHCSGWIVEQTLDNLMPHSFHGVAVEERMKMVQV